MRPTEVWRVLLQKAAQDEYVVDQLIELPQSPDEILGFHLQQAAEKYLKSLLSHLRIEYRFTHNLGELMHILEKKGHPVPPELRELKRLTPFATEWRYDFIAGEGESALDRKAMRQLVVLLREWVRKTMAAHQEAENP